MTHARRADERGVITLTFTRDEKLNAVSAEMLDALRLALDDLEFCPEARVLVIAAEGRYFTAGMDIGAIDLGGMGAGQEAFDGANFRAHYRKLHALFDRLEQIEKPVIAAIQGPCCGVGVEFTVSCDFRLCSTMARFVLPEVENLSVLPGSGGVSRLTRLVGPHWARWMAMAGKSVPAERALAIGLVHDVYPAADLAAEADALAHHLASLSQQAVGLAKLTIDAAAGVDRGTARDIDRLANSILIASPEHQRRIDEFNSRRGAR